MRCRAPTTADLCGGDIAQREQECEQGRLGAAARAGAASVVVTSLPPGVRVGWDAADALAEGWDETRTAALIASATSVGTTIASNTATAPATESDGQTTGGRQRTPQRDVLIGLTEFVELWHDANRIAYASFQVGEHHENWPIRSRDFRMWLSGKFFEQTGGAIGGQALEDGIRILEARAVNEGPPYACFVRTAYLDGKMYVDRGDPNWHAVEITAAGWRVIDKPPIKFLRSPSMRALPEPELGSLIEDLRRFITLVVACSVAWLRPRGPFPILVINGEAGSGKSFFSRIMRSLADPSAAPIRAMPRDDRDLVVSAGNSWVLAFDNLSNVPTWFADALCRLATGSGFATRMLHTDIDEERRPEEELWEEFGQAWPRIFGALLDAVSRALGNIANVKIDRAPRMADFAKWITAAEPGLGWEPGTFLTAYRENRRDVSEASLEADSVALAIDKLCTTERQDGFQGTATELLSAINSLVPETTRKSKYWPQTAAQLGNRVARATPLLRAKGYIVERRHSGTRTITIIPSKRD